MAVFIGQLTLVIAVNPHPTLLRLLGATLVGLRRLEDSLLLAIDDHRGGLEGETEGVPGHRLIGPAANAEDHVGASKTLGCQALQNQLGPFQGNGVTIDGPDMRIQDLIAQVIDLATKGIPEALN